MATLFDQFGRPIRPTAKPERRPLAVAPVLNTWRDYVASGLTPERLATIFIEADGGNVGRQSELFDQIEERDGHLLGEKSKRQNIILDLDFNVTPASDDSRDAKVAEFIEEYIDNATDWPDVLTAMQDGVGKGFSAQEIDWDVSSGQAVPERLTFIEQKRFLFTDSEGYLRRIPLLLSDENPMGDEIPAWKMLFHRYGGKSGHPARSGIFRVCAWMYLFKNYSIKDWVIFCEVYGMPLRLGKYEVGADKADKDALFAAISSLGSDAAGVISKATEIEFIETSSGKGSGDLYEALVKFCNAEMSKAILGQTLTAEVGDKGSYAASQTHNDVRIDLLKADGRAVASTIRDQIIRPLVGFNFGWDTPVPKYESVWEEAEDLNAKAEWIGELLDRGVKMPVSFVRQEFNIPEPEDGEETVGGSKTEESVSSQVAKLQAAASAGRGSDLSPGTTLDAIGEQALDLADASNLMAPIEKLLADSKSLEEFRDGLLAIYNDMDESALGDLMARALAVADLSGRFDVETDPEP